MHNFSVNDRSDPPDHQVAANDLIKHGIAAFKARERMRAELLFAEATRLDPDNQLAWTWLAGCVASEQEKREHLQHAIEIDPTSAIGQRAAAGLAQLTGHTPPAPAPEPAAPAAPAAPEPAAPAAPTAPAPEPPAAPTGESALPFTLGEHAFRAGERTFFLFDGRNRAFVEGREQRPREPVPTLRGGMIVTLGVATLLLGTWLIMALVAWAQLIATLLAGGPPPLALVEVPPVWALLVRTLVSGTLLGISVWVLLSHIMRYAAYERAQPASRVLAGQIAYVNTLGYRFYDDEDDTWISHALGIVVYRFADTDGMQRSRWIVHQRYDLKEEAPPPGTPVLVWHQGGNHYALL
jgi:hypothetical protein